MPLLTDRVDALLVLGGEDRDHWPRSRAALRCYVACQAAGAPLPRLIVSGGALLPCVGADGRAVEATEAACMMQFLQAQGVPAEHVLQEARAQDTLGNVAWGGALARRHGLRRVALVSDDFHLWRSRRLFERVWGHPPTACVGSGHQGSWRLRLREPLVLALQLAVLRRRGIRRADSAAHLDFVAARP